STLLGNMTLPLAIVTNDSPLFPCVASTCSSHPLFGTLEQLDRSLVGKIQVVGVNMMWEHILIVGLMVVENKRCGEGWIGTHLMDK
ncbi:hypothetical protein Tco_1382355, partial [Tanacetum coccineum]